MLLLAPMVAGSEASNERLEIVVLKGERLPFYATWRAEATCCLQYTSAPDLTVSGEEALAKYGRLEVEVLWLPQKRP